MTDEKPRNPDGEEAGGGNKEATPLTLTALKVLKATRILDPAAWQVKRLATLVLVMVLVVVAVGVGRHGVVRINENQVGILANNLTRTLTLQPRVGYHFFLPYISRIYVLDKTIQRLELTWAQRGAPPRDIKLRVADGSQVSLDLTVDFKLRPEDAVRVIQRSGPGDRFARLWMEASARHYALKAFGSLTMEQLYDAELRAAKAQLVQESMNKALSPEGIEVVAVIPGEFRFYAEYERIIQDKKLADQQVEEQQAQARAAQEDQERRIIEMQKELEVRKASFAAEMAARLVQAQADAEKRRREADGQYSRAKLQADSRLYTMERQAKAALEKGSAEAEGLAKTREAMRGDGGLNTAALEYARQLEKIRITGTPITRDPAVRQFSVEAGEAAATRGGRP